MLAEQAPVQGKPHCLRGCSQDNSVQVHRLDEHPREVVGQEQGQAAPADAQAHRAGPELCALCCRQALAPERPVLALAHHCRGCMACHTHDLCTVSGHAQLSVQASSSILQRHVSALHLSMPSH